MAEREKNGDEDLVQAAEELVRQAVEPLRGLLTEEERDLIKFLLECDLLVDPEGRRELRRALGDPEVEASEHVTAPGAAEKKAKIDEGEGVK